MWYMYTWIALVSFVLKCYFTNNTALFIILVFYNCKFCILTYLPELHLVLRATSVRQSKYCLRWLLACTTSCMWFIKCLLRTRQAGKQARRPASTRACVHAGR